jgi:hypothetical protein
MHTHIRTRIHTRIHTSTHTHPHTRIHNTYTHTRTYTPIQNIVHEEEKTPARQYFSFSLLHIIQNGIYIHTHKSTCVLEAGKLNLLTMYTKTCIRIHTHVLFKDVQTNTHTHTRVCIYLRNTHAHSLHQKRTAKHLEKHNSKAPHVSLHRKSGGTDSIRGHVLRRAD